MKLLADTRSSRLAEILQAYDFVGGQLLTPLTRFSDAGGVYAIDNGAFSMFDKRAFLSLLDRQREHIDRCLFVAVPDVVGSARRTMEVFRLWYPMLCEWPVAMVCQDGMEEYEIPWLLLRAVFIGGTTDFKLSNAVVHIIKAAQLLGVHTHVGRVNTAERWKYFEQLGVDTCDGSGVSRYDWMLTRIDRVRRQADYPLFDAADADGIGGGCDGAGDVGAGIPGCDEAGAILD